MSFIFGLLGGLLGIILAVVILIFIVYISVQRFVGGVNLRDLFRVAKNVKDLQRQEYSREKEVNGMTKIYEPRIIEDFGDFNKELLYNVVEKGLTSIFNSIENKSMKYIKENKDLKLLEPEMEEFINDIKNRGVDISYDAIKFHKHAIKKYERMDGMATVTVSSTVEYYYKNSEAKNDYSDIKKQTRYTTKFVYIYDDQKLDPAKISFAINCPNCGAPLKSVGAGECAYCGTYVEPVNLKSWKMLSYKEDYD